MPEIVPDIFEEIKFILIYFYLPVFNFIQEDEEGYFTFKNKNIRWIFHDGERLFSVVDIIEVITDSDRPRKYWSDLKARLQQEGSELSEKIGQLKMKSTDGKSYLSYPFWGICRKNLKTIIHKIVDIFQHVIKF